MEPQIYERLCSLAQNNAGIALGPAKQALVSSRIGKRLAALGLASERAYLEHLESDRSGEELVRFLDAISTNHTSFFREPDHFERLGNLVRQWYQAGQRRFRIWSAASSTGEEPYSIVMTVLDALAGRAADFRLLATDISTRVLASAEAGQYHTARLAAVPPELLKRYFTKPDSGGLCRAKGVVRNCVTFTRLNLSQPPFPMKGPFDIVFCRNVLIYFDQHVRQRLIQEAEKLLRPGGWLFIGHTETLTGLGTGLRMERPSCFFAPSRVGHVVQGEARP
jgi:chemotaxis protein methyltransferase CheR